jgi:hypothetical protein
MLVKCGRQKIPANLCEIGESEFVGAEGGVVQSNLLHEISSEAHSTTRIAVGAGMNWRMS